MEKQDIFAGTSLEGNPLGEEVHFTKKDLVITRLKRELAIIENLPEEEMMNAMINLSRILNENVYDLQVNCCEQIHNILEEKPKS